MMPCAAAEPTFEEPGGERVEPLLAGRVPELHLDVPALDLEDLDLEVDRDGRQVVDREVVFREALQETGLADPAFADQQHLREVVVLVRVHPLPDLHRPRRRL